jgi:hypothetical protein
MAKPTIAWMPVRYIHPILQGQMTLWDWLRQAPAFGVQAVEIYHAFLREALLPAAQGGAACAWTARESNHLRA